MPEYCKRLIEVDLPIGRISAHARKEKNIRHGHISTLHIWWARRPLAACRAVICASLWPDPADPLCQTSFVKAAKAEMKKWSKECLGLLSEESYPRFNGFARHPKQLDDMIEIRKALLDFIADFANWDNSIVREYLDTSRVLTQAAHEALGGAGTHPLVVDSFAGGGSIPLEALRVGADAFGSDLNPVPVLLNKVLLEYIPKYGNRLADEVRKWGEWIKREAARELTEFYPKDEDGATPIAYLWARTIRCEGPGCGAEVPLIRSLWLAKKDTSSAALQLVPNRIAKRVDFQIVVKERNGWVSQADLKTKVANPRFEGTVKRGSATCPCCGYTTAVAGVRKQLRERHGGANDARLLCVVSTRAAEQGRFYRLPTAHDEKAVRLAQIELKKRLANDHGPISLVPNERLDVRGIRRVQVPNYGMETWGDLFTARQLLSLVVLSRLVAEAGNVRSDGQPHDELSKAVQTILALAVSRIADIANSLCSWKASMSQAIHLFTRQAIPIVWDFAETSLVSDAAGDFGTTIGNMVRILEREAGAYLPGHAEFCSATALPLPDDSAHAFITDPPYYDAITYSYLSDFFYVWLRRALRASEPSLFGEPVVPKDAEIIVDPPHELSDSHKTIEFYELELTKAFAEGRRVLRPEGICTIVFASKTTASWEAILKAVVDAGWTITGSWPIDTEMETRIAATGQARLASSVHLVCRPRENREGSMRSDETGDWRNLLQELPGRIHEWMPRLAEEGVVGADAIFACLGPALEIFSRYSRVEKASGETVTLKEYLEQVWAAVAKEALTMIFRDADATGFEEDARLTAMWLWTLYSANGTDEPSEGGATDSESEEENQPTKPAQPRGYLLEFDAARKIAQGLGAHLEDLAHLVEIKGDKATLLSAAARARYLFGKEAEGPAKSRTKKKNVQLALDFGQEVQALENETDGEWAVGLGERVGSTTLDQLHQSMILFGAGRGEALRRLLVEEGVGRNARFWALAQALAALYPPGTDERRWVEGVQARKKGLGL